MAGGRESRLNGFLKKGGHSVGVARQRSGTAGRIESCQVGVFAAHASRWGQALVDRRLYLPRGWAEDAARRETASAPDETAFATKPALAREMIAAARDAGVPCAWVLADALCGSDHHLRRMLEKRQRRCQLNRLRTSEALIAEGFRPRGLQLAATRRALRGGEGGWRGADRRRAGGTKRLRSAEKTETKRWRPPGERKPCIWRSRFRKGTWLFSARLLSLLWARCSRLGATSCLAAP